MKLKKVTLYLGALTICTTLLFAGCGSSNSNTSSSAESSTTTESSSNDQESEENSNQVPETKNAVKDNSYSIRKNATKGSTTKLDGKYHVSEAPGVYYYFDGNGTCYYVQTGSYAFTTDSDGKHAVNLHFNSTDLDQVYTISSKGKKTTLTTIVSGATSETNLKFKFVTGKNGLSGKKDFEGIYGLIGASYYRMEFHSDRSFYMVVEQSYKTKKNKLTLSAGSGKNSDSLSYTYKFKDGNLILSSDGNTVATLEPTD